MNNHTSSNSILKHCCSVIYKEIERMGLSPAREEIVRNENAVNELVEQVKQVWVEDCGGDAEHFPWNRDYVLHAYIGYRKDSRMTKDGIADSQGLLPFTFSGFVYLIENANNHIKIGWTEKSPHARLRELQTGDSEGLHIVAIIEGNRSLEKALHYRFAGYRIRKNGEWFYRHDELNNFIKEHLPCQ